MTDPSAPEDTPALPRENPQIPDTINAPQQNPFKELLLLTGSVLGALLILVILLWQGLTFIAPYIPLHWEQRISQPFNTPATASAQQQALQQRLDRILVAMEYRGEEPIRLKVIDNEMVNAFATLGGQIVVAQGLLDALTTDVGLDMVLAHEAAHILNRDPIRAATGVLGVTLVFALIFGNQDLSQLYDLVGTGGELLLLSYSRDQERAADERALAALTLLYDDLHDAAELFYYVSQQHDHDEPAFLSTHPHPDERIEMIQRYIAAND